MRVLIAVTSDSTASAVAGIGAWVSQRLDASPTVLSGAPDKDGRAHASATASEVVRLLAEAGVVAQRREYGGTPMRAIAREAAAGGFELVVTGDIERRGLRAHVPHESDVARLVAQLSCHVIVARGAFQPDGHALLCASGAQHPSLAERYCEQLTPLAEGFREVVVLHVMSQISAAPGTPEEDLVADAGALMATGTPEGEILTDALRAFARLSVTARPVVRHGGVVDEVLAEARNDRCSLVVIGAFLGSGWHRLLLDDLSRRIVAQVDRPILIVR